MGRRTTRGVRVGSVGIGSAYPVSVQTMTTTHTEDVEATLAQIGELAALGCEIIRCAAPTRKAARALGRIVERSPIPVIADVHFDCRLALLAVEAGAHGVRINPGNMRDQEGLKAVYRAAARAGAKIRIGVNSGSIRPRKGLEVRAEEAAEDLADLMVREVLSYCEAAEREGFSNIVLSLKASDAPTTIAAYRAAAARCDYPLHLGVTAAGPPRDSIVRSAVGIGTLLAEGIGDTIRVSMTGPPHEEVRAGIAILEALRLREPTGPRIISCPTCARCEIDLSALVQEVERRLEGLSDGVRIAVMGCVVNGPGEAAEADVGIAGGRSFGYLFRAGKKVRRVEAAELADALVDEVRALCAERALSAERARKGS
jgi:(E)-4-hydroxy-3-methylbut-2-enyl-diphosphate synthase